MTRHRGLCVVCVAIVLQSAVGGQAAVAPTAERERALLGGSWRAVSIESENGRSAPEDAAKVTVVNDAD